MRGLIVSLVLFFAGAGSAAAATEVPVVSIPLRGGLSLALSPAGKADIEPLGTVSRVRIEIERISPPERLSSAMNVYVAWAVSPEGAAENLGALSVDEGRGRLETVTRLDRFGLLITAEPHYLVDAPSAAVAYVNMTPRETSIRRAPAQVETGRYSYAALKPATAPAGTMTLVKEARAALQIARSVNAERFAENEFRQARVALETMEAMLSRSNPPEVVMPAAHDAIRHAARATAIARDSAAGRDSSFSFEDGFVDKTSGALTSAGREAVQRIVAALSHWNGPLRIRCSAATVAPARSALTQAGVPEDRLLFITVP